MLQMDGSSPICYMIDLTNETAPAMISRIPIILQIKPIVCRAFLLPLVIHPGITFHRRIPITISTIALTIINYSFDHTHLL